MQLTLQITLNRFDDTDVGNSSLNHPPISRDLVPLILIVFPVKIPFLCAREL